MIYDRKKDVIRKMKEVAKEIVNEESAKKGIDIIIHPMTIVEYYRSDIFKTNLVLIDSHNKKRFDYTAIAEPFKSRGFYISSKKELVVFIKKLSKIKKVDFEIVWADFISSIYHELKHRFQYKDRREVDRLSFRALVFDIELLIQCLDCSYYRTNHDKFYCEIEARLYGINNALDYLKRKNSLTSLQAEHLEERKNIYDCYDFQTMLDKFNQIIVNAPGLEIDNWLGIFYNQDKTFRTVSQILTNPNINLVDKEFLEAFFSNKVFLKKVDFSSLNPEQKQIIIDALNNSLNSEITKRKNLRDALNNKRISNSEWLEIDTITATRIVYYMRKISEFTNKLVKTQDKPNDCNEIFGIKK